MTTYVEIHALHTLPPSNMNRDDTGAPKSATFGGVVRQRVSSQAFKRAIREDFANTFDPNLMGVRTQRVVDVVVERLRELAPDMDLSASQKAVSEVFGAAGIKLAKTKKGKSAEDDGGSDPHGDQTGYLLFLSRKQIDNIAQFIVDNAGTKPDKKTAKVLFDTDHSVDIAMFGRMVADASDLNVDASVQVAHAIGVHESEPEFDFFTAVDDEVARAEETGAGMLGTVQMMSSTMYRYATVHFDGLGENLGDDATAARAATIAFVRSFIRALPQGKVNTFANWTLPELVYVTVRSDRPVSLVNAFEEPVAANTTSSRRQVAAERMASEARSIAEAFDVSPDRAWVIGTADLGAAFDGLAEPVTLLTLEGALEAYLRGSAE